MTGPGRYLAVAAWALTGCASSPMGLDAVRFSDRPIVWQVDDERPIPEAPETRVFLRNLYFFRQSFVRPMERSLDRVVVGPATNVNALGEVPDSTWFENRARRGLTVDQVRRGPNRSEGPAAGKWRVLSTKVGGVSPGFIIEDGDGGRFILKFDAPDGPEIETGAHVVCHRLLWAIGYQVPEDDIVEFSAERLDLAEDAVEKTLTGDEKKLTPERLAEILRPMHRDGEGRIRGLVSRFLPGRPLGGFPQLGVREDDPNDRIPHELRREIRGAWMFFAWLGHTDVKEDNTLDVYVTESGRKFVRHHLIDFGKALGGMGYLDRVAMDGFAHYFDPGELAESLFTFGLVTQPWERMTPPSIRGVGRFDAEQFEPELWKPFYPYIPFDVRDEQDDLWAARILRRIDDELVTAALEAAKYSDPRAVAYLRSVLRARRDKLLAWAYRRSNAVDGFTARGRKLCFGDLWHADGFGAGPTEYRLQIFDETGALRFDDSRTSQDEICVDVANPAWTPYRVLRIDNLRLEHPQPVDLHLRVQAGSIRLLGIRRHPRR